MHHDHPDGRTFGLGWAISLMYCILESFQVQLFLVHVRQGQISTLYTKHPACPKEHSPLLVKGQAMTDKPDVRHANPGAGWSGHAAVHLLGMCPGRSLDRQAVSGTIRLGGQPLAAGAVLLDPVSEQAGTAVGATIHDGAFVIARKERTGSRILQGTHLRKFTRTGPGPQGFIRTEAAADGRVDPREIQFANRAESRNCLGSPSVP